MNNTNENLSIPERIYEAPRPKVALVVGTFGSVPYIHLHLESWKRNYPEIPIMIHDDGSSKSDQIAELCRQYGAAYSCNSEHWGHNVGDLSVYTNGFRWASEIGSEILIKMSRRWIPVTNWVPALQQLAYETQYATFSNVDQSEGLGFRTECIGFHVQTWLRAGLVAEINRQVDQRQPDAILVEVIIHELARKGELFACHANQGYISDHPRPHETSAYAIWDLLGTSRRARLPHVLWHHACDPVEYCRALLQYGIEYPLQELLSVNG